MRKERQDIIDLVLLAVLVKTVTRVEFFSYSYLTNECTVPMTLIAGAVSLGRLILSQRQQTSSTAEYPQR